ncbi:protease [Hymenobacter sp. BT664]|uniref:Protease n=1 Tax=Hymenobacter montanus TaxID=2771359 RepID=A0A927GLF5_9BACT|nr:M57 family metalloprotease [Hymenobacter montanus]MBD2770547.1 protease [Hymenobacter montanus]
MNTHFKYVALGFLATAALFTESCQKKAVEPSAPSEEPITDAVRAQIKALGFSSLDARRTEGGYVVENDIFLTPADLTAKPSTTNLRVGDEEQYHTNNLVSGLPRQITVSMDVANFPVSYQRGLDEAIRRYNAQNLRVTFRRVSSGGMIKVLKWSEGGAVAGFPSGGNPYGTIKANPASLGNINSVNYAATVLSHEMGHCIGFRHTDYATRRSCGSGGGESAGSAGAVFIPGTSAGFEAKSWMLACQDGGDRPFTANDVKALNYLY